MLDRLCRASTTSQQLFRTSRDSRSLSKKSQKIFRSLTDFVELLQLRNSYLGLPRTPGVFQKILEHVQSFKKCQKIFRSLTVFVGIPKLHNYYLGPPESPGVFQKIVENIQELDRLCRFSITLQIYLGLPGTPGVFQKNHRKYLGA